MEAAAMEVARLVLRQDAAAESESTPVCAGSNDYDGRMGVRISSIFVIFVGSLWGKSISSQHITSGFWVSVYHCH
jgi:zinc transporter 1/2/3